MFAGPIRAACREFPFSRVGPLSQPIAVRSDFKRNGFCPPCSYFSRCLWVSACAPWRVANFAVPNRRPRRLEIALNPRPCNKVAIPNRRNLALFSSDSIQLSSILPDRVANPVPYTLRNRISPNRLSLQQLHFSGSIHFCTLFCTASAPVFPGFLCTNPPSRIQWTIGNGEIFAAIRLRATHNSRLSRLRAITAENHGI
jgi:hypothetical protein